MGTMQNLVRDGVWRGVAKDIDVGRVFYVTATCTYANLASAAKVDVCTPEIVPGNPGAQYKIRDIVLVGGGTSFHAASGDRLISLTDGTTVWTTIANADVESAPSASLRWGDTKVPFLTSTSNTASVAGAQIYFAYSGGSADHTTAGSLTFSVGLERVA